MRTDTRIVFVLILANIFIFSYSFLHNDTHVSAFSTTLLWIVVVLLAGRLSRIITKFKQPAVLGELLIGLLLGNLVLLGIDAFEPIRHNEILHFLSELGIILLMFNVGLETNIEDILKVGGRCLAVASLGVVVPFLFGFGVSSFLFPEQSVLTHLFLGATLTATSIGITARVLRDLGKIRHVFSRIILGAAVIDDVLALVILALVSGLVTTSTISLSTVVWAIGKAGIFLLSAVIIGQLLAHRMSEFLSQIHRSTEMKFTFAICLCFLYAYIAHVIGLEPIIGAFAAGVMLDAVHFSNFRDTQLSYDIKRKLKGVGKKAQDIQKILDRHNERHIEQVIQHVSFLVVPIFFVLTGFSVNLGVLANKSILFAAFALTFAAIASKLFAGLAAGKGRRWIVGWGMVPRAEVVLIFGTVGKNLGVINDQIFSILFVVVICTTFITPPVLSFLLRKSRKLAVLNKVT